MHLFFTVSIIMNNQNEADFDQKVDSLYKLYLDPASGLFLDSSLPRIYQQANRDAQLAPTDYNSIIRYKRSIEAISRSRQRRAIGNRPRHLSFRRWITWGPNNILLGSSLKFK